MTPGEVNLRAFHFYKQRDEAERSAWKRDAYFTALLLNVSGKSLKRNIKGDDLVRFKNNGGNVGAADKPQVTGAERRRQMLETLRFQKKKFWGEISDKALADFEASVASSDGK
jgi:hypothetical protein